MLKKLKLTIVAIFISGCLFAIPNLTIHGCANGSYNKHTNTLYLTCNGTFGDCVVLSAGTAPNGQPGWRLSVNWACQGGSWVNYWLIEYPVIIEFEDKTELTGNVIPGM